MGKLTVHTLRSRVIRGPRRILISCLILVLIATGASYADGYDHTVEYTAVAGNGATVRLRLIRGRTGMGEAIVESRRGKVGVFESITYRVAWGRFALAGSGDSVRVYLASDQVVHIYCTVKNTTCSTARPFFLKGLLVPAQEWTRSVMRDN